MYFGDSITFRPGSFARIWELQQPAGDVLVHARDGLMSQAFLPGSLFYDQGYVWLRRPRIGVLLVGTNDALRGIDPETYQANIENFIDQAFMDGVGEMVVMTAPKLFDIDGRFDVANEFLVEYRERALDVCEVPDDDVFCGPDLWSLLTQRDIRSDGVHPDGSGNRVIERALRPWLL
jgi:lysophospholipase L1-like esterase